VEKTQALISKNINKQQGWVEGRTFVRLVHLGRVSGAKLLKVRLDVPRALSRWSRRIVLALLRDVLQFIGSDDG
jgi:hypothetical protein